MTEVEGVVLNTVKYSETSAIINVITKKYGTIGIIAKGAYKQKSPFFGLCEKLTYAKFNIIYKKNKLSILTNIDVIDNLKIIKKNIDKISYSYYLLELTNQVIKENQNEQIYEIFIQALLKINKEINPAIILTIIEAKYLIFLGIRPNLNNCSNCQNPNIIGLSSHSGGAICQNCIDQYSIKNKEALILLKTVTLINIETITETNINKQTLNLVNKFLNDYYHRYTGLYMKSKEFITKLNQINN